MESTPTGTDPVAALRALPDQASHTFALKARELLESITQEDLQSVLDSESEHLETRFNAFYLIQARTWQAKDYTKHRERTDKYRLDLGEQPLFPFLEAEYYLAHATNKSNAMVAIENSRTAVERLPRTPGVLNLFGEAIATVGEEFPDLVETRLIVEGERALRRAQTMAMEDTGRPYAKYGATLARLQALRKSWDEARRSIAQAIDQEDSRRSDYALRMLDYQLVKAKISISADAEELHKQQAAALAEMRDARKDTLTVLGLLAAVIAFLVTTVNIATSFPPRDASSLMLVSAGTLLLVFIGYSALFSRASWTAVGMSALVAALLLGFGAFLGAFDASAPKSSGVPVSDRVGVDQRALAMAS